MQKQNLFAEKASPKTRLECFGDANTSDACMQCPDNEECAKETINRWKKGGDSMSKRVKIFCHCCEGKKTVEEKAYPNGETVKAICPECNGEGWVYVEVGV